MEMSLAQRQAVAIAEAKMKAAQAGELVPDGGYIPQANTLHYNSEPSDAGVSDKDYAVKRQPSLMEHLTSPETLASFAAGLVPGSGFASAGGVMPDFKGGFDPSIGTNLRAGNYGEAAGQGLALAGDAMMALPALGATVGTALRAPRAAYNAITKMHPSQVHGPFGATDTMMSAAERIGVTVPQFMASDSQAVNKIGTQLGGTAFGSPIASSTARMVEEMGNAAEGIGKQLGSANKDLAAADLKSSITRHNQGKSAAAPDYTALENIVSQTNAVTPLTNTQQAAFRIAAEREAARIVGDSPALKTVNAAIDPALTPNGLGYAEIKRLRGSVGEKLDESILSTGKANDELKAMYSSLTRDLKDNIRANGGQAAVDLFERANAMHRLDRVQRKSLEKIIGVKGDVSAEQVFQHVQALASAGGRADARKLELVKKAVGPKVWDDFSSAIVTGLGRNADGEFSPALFIGQKNSAYNRLSEAGKRALFSPDHKLTLDQIAMLSSEYEKRYSAFVNRSNTANTGATLATGAGIATEILSGTLPIYTLGSLLGGHVLATALAKPATAKAVENYLRAGTRSLSLPPPSREAAMYSATKLLGTALQKHGIADAEQVIKQITGPVAGRAEDNQEQ